MSKEGDDITLEERDLPDVLEALLDAKDKAYNLGLRLGVPVNEAKSIRDNFKDPEDRLTHIIEEFLKQIDPSTSWRIIVNALRSPLVKLQRLANDIESAKLVKSAETIDVEHNVTTPVESKAPMTDIELSAHTSHSVGVYKSTSSGRAATNYSSQFVPETRLCEHAQPKTMVVLNELQQLTVDEMKQLMRYLNVPLNVLNGIEMQLFGDDCRKMQFIDEWLRVDNTASWRKLVSGLRIMRMDVIANCIESLFVEVADSTQQSIGAINFDQPTDEFSVKVAKAKSSILDLKHKFFKLTCNALTKLSQNVREKPEFLEDVRNYLLMLPMANEMHEKFLSLRQHDIREAEDMQRLFIILKQYCSYYLNYDIVLDLIKSFCDSLKQNMLDYSALIEQFERSTTADVFLKANSCDHQCKVFRTFEKMALKINKPSSECTLYDIRQIRRAIAEAAAVNAYSVHMEVDSEGSVGVSLYVHPACIDLVKAAMTHEFMELYHLTMEGTVGELESITNMDTQPLTDPSLPLLSTTVSPLPFIAPPLQPTTSPLQPIAFPLQPITSTSPPTTSPVETSAQVDRPPSLPLAQPSAPPHIPDQSSASQDKIAEVKATIQHFKEEFDDLFHCTQTYIENQDANFFSEFRSYLLVLPVSDWDHSVTLFNRDEITVTRKTSEIFVVIGNYCNYFHHDLLVAINMRFCEVPQKRRMLEYQKSFERFEEATDVHLYLQAVPVFPSLKFFDRCSSVVLDNHLSISDCKLSKLKELKYDLANVYSVRLYGLFIENIRGDPIVVTFRIHPNVEVPPVIITIRFDCGR